jgi:hypothetical protein
MLSTKVTTAVHEVLLSAASLTVNVTVVFPGLSVAPGAGDCVTLKVLQLSVAAISPVRSGIVGQLFASAVIVTLLAQCVIVGAAVSAVTVTV